MAVIEATDLDFQTLLKTHEKVMVKYFADWCGSCKLIAPKYKRLSGDERFSDIAFLEVNAEENPEARKAAGVSNLPFFAVFKNGSLKESAATNKEEAIVAMLDQLKN